MIKQIGKRKPAILKANEAVSLIENDSVVLTTGFTILGVAEEIYKKLADRFLQSGTPRDLTLVHPAGQSFKGNGIDQLAHEGLLKRIIGSHWGLCPGLSQLIQENKVEGFCYPMGQLIGLIRAKAANRPGCLSKIGLGTFIDPLYEGGKLNLAAWETGENLIQQITLDQEDYLFYKSINFDIYIGRGTTADEDGNITTEDEAVKLSMLAAAQAVKACGGKVIIQVKHIAKSGTLCPKDIVIPGIFVDAIVVSEEPEKYHRQTMSTVHNPTLTGKYKVPVEKGNEVKQLDRLLIGERAVKEIAPGDVVNLGVGIPGDAVGGVIERKNLSSSVILTVESGIIGGIPLGGGDFGTSKNADAIIQDQEIFDYYNGWGVDVTFMGAAEVDVNGNVNVSKFGSRSVGCGGFIDITQSAKKVVFCFTFTSGGLEIAVKDGKLQIVKEGKYRKFLNNIGQVTFSSSFARKEGQSVWFVTERAVFRLDEAGLELTEVAPGIDLERDVLNYMDFKPKISSSVKQMELSVKS